jgi:hypothetical protein
MKNELDGLRNLNKWRIQFRKKKKKYFKKSATINKQKTTQVDKIIQTRFMQIRQN